MSICIFLLATKVVGVKVVNGEIVYLAHYCGGGNPKDVKSTEARSSFMPLIVDYYEDRFMDVLE